MKTFKFLNILIIIGIVLINIFYIGKNIIDGEFIKLIDNGILFFLILVPFLIRKIIKVNLSELFIFLFYIYGIVTILLGDVMNLIKYTLWFDKIVHGFFGFLTALVSVLIIKYQKKNLKEKLFFNILFIIGFTLLIACSWEFIEYSVDKIFHTNHQRWKQTGLNDTMLDLIVAFLGSIIVSLSYFIENKVNKFGLVFHSIRDDNTVPNQKQIIVKQEKK